MIHTVSGMCLVEVESLRKITVSGAGTTLSVAPAPLVAIMPSRGNQRPPIGDGCGSSGGSEVVRFRSSGVAGVPVHDGAGVTPHRLLKVAFIPSNLVKATFSHYRTAPEGTRVTPVTGASPEPRCPFRRATPI